MTVELTVAISIAATVIGAVLGIVGARRTAIKDNVIAGREMGEINARISELIGKVSALNEKIDKINDNYTRVSSAIAKLEVSLELAHHRLDRLDGGRMWQDEK